MHRRRKAVAKSAQRGLKSVTTVIITITAGTSYFEGVVENDLSAFLNQRWAEKYADNTASWTCTIDIPLSDSAYPSAQTEDTEENEELIKAALKAYARQSVLHRRSPRNRAFHGRL